MIAGGFVYIVLYFRGRTWRHFLIWLLGGVLYALAGAFVISAPILASALLTLMFAFVLMASGAARIWLGWAARSESGWDWLIAAGLVTLAAGIFRRCQLADRRSLGDPNGSRGGPVVPRVGLYLLRSGTLREVISWVATAKRCRIWIS
ncbi:MAG: DUF308 domain-containing protein [Afipia sp.]|nr:DUF308 domain-containing protein [Afipia sp.]